MSHTSYHASGEYHHRINDTKKQKKDRQKIQEKQRQQPDKNFSGTENLIRTAIEIDDHSKINIPCKESEFQGLFEIPITDLKPRPRLIQLSVDLVEPNEKPVLPPRAITIREADFQDSVPWILCTLFDIDSD